MKWDDTLPVDQNARERLPRLLEKFYAAGRAVADHEDPATLHRFRLQGKRVRYTLELFRPIYGPGLEKLLQALKKAQTALGEINDCATAKQIASHPQFHKWVQNRQDDLRKDFRKYWFDKFDAPGQEKVWVSYLQRYARQPSAKRRKTK